MKEEKLEKSVVRKTYQDAKCQWRLAALELRHEVELNYIQQGRIMFYFDSNQSASNHWFPSV